jgi:hypothetical protein
MDDTSTNSMNDHPGAEINDVINSLPITLQSSRKKIVLFILFSLLMSVAAIGMRWAGAGAWIYVLALLFVAMAGLLGVSSFHPPVLTIAKEGFGVTGVFRRRSVIFPWDHIESFNVLKVGLQSLITFQFTEKSGRMRMQGGRTLPDSFGMPAVKLVETLEICRIHFTEKKILPESPEDSAAAENSPEAQS